MKMLQRVAACLTLGAAGMCVMTHNAMAAGVAVGSSSLISTLDYSDTFTGTDAGGRPDRPFIPAVQPPAAYGVENTYGNPPQSFQGAGFSFAADGPGTPGFVAGANAYPIDAAPNASGAGSDTGFTQTGGAVDYGLTYYLRDEYIVQVDAVQNPDRVDISSGAAVGIFAPNSLSVFFRGDGSGNASLFNGSVDTSIQSELPEFNTGITQSGAWYNYAVRYDRLDKELEVYVNEVSRGIVDLTTFAGGIYQDFSNAVVGAGGSGGDRTWTDNFQVGGDGPATGMPPMPHADPGNLVGLPDSLVSFWDFNEAAGPVEGRLLDFAYDRKGDRNGTFRGTATRAPGYNVGAAQFNDVNGDGVSVGSEGFSFTDGLTIEMLFATDWDGSDQAEFFRKEDGNDRILLSFQAGPNINNAFGQLVGTEGTPGISLGLNVGGYGELDIAFDGLEGRPTLAEVADGETHHLVATFDGATGVKSVFLDGQLIGSVDLGDDLQLLSGGAAEAFIGATGGQEPFTGLLDEVAIYNTALTQSEIAMHIQNVLSGAPNYFNAVPEPTSVTLLAISMALLAISTRRRK
jgi:hypothetical protein